MGAKKTGDPLNDIYVVITERDHSDPLKSRGAIAMETMTGKANMINAVDKGKRFNNKYGQVYIAKLEVVGTLAECAKIIEEPME